jgi:HSP20 family protein
VTITESLFLRVHKIRVDSDNKRCARCPKMTLAQSRKVNIMDTLITWNQLREMEEATQNRFNRFLGGFPNRIGNGETHSLTVADWSPRVDISQDDHEYLLKADLPEMKKDDVRVIVEDGILCVSGQRKNEKEDQKRKFHRIERSFGNFRRSFTLPEDADSTKVTAEFRDGVLKVHLPTTARARSKATEVKVA